ncbi:hypothetical protein D3C71_2083260 [compost metagenome]
MISKQKLLQWVEDKRFVYSEPYENEEVENMCKQSLHILNALKRSIDLGEFVVDNGE